MKTAWFVLPIIFIAYTLSPAQTALQQAYRDFEQCALSLTRAERAVDRLLEEMKRLEEMSRRRPEDAAMADLIQAQSVKNDRFLSSLDRLRDEAAENRADLDAVNGPVCPSCLASAVDQFCRNSGSLLRETEDELRQLEDRLGRHETPSFSTVERPDSASIPENKPASKWRVSLGADYYRFQDVDTAVMTARERDSLRRLEEAPLSFYARAGFSRSWTGPYGGTFDPVLTISDRRSRLALPLGFCPGLSFLRVEPSLKAEKSFQGGRGGFSAAVQGDSSDMGGAGLVLKTVKGDAGPGNADYSIPVGIEWEHYRENRPGYVSNLTLRVSPFWEHRLDNGSLGLFADARLEDCYGHDNGRLDADSLDAVLARATLSSERRFPLFSVSSEFSFSGDRYLSDKRREKRDVYEPVVRIGAGHDGKPRSDLEVRYEWERSQRGQTLTGDRLRLLARGEIPLNPGWSVRPGFLFEDRSAPLKKVSSPASGEDYFLYLWEAFSALEPLAGVSFQREKGGLFLSGAFRYEDVTDNKAYFLKDSRTWKAAGNGEWRFLERWLLIASGEYQYRIYCPFDSNSRQTSNLSVSASVSTRF